MNEKIAYILTTYPCASQTFIRNEISLLKAKGLDVVVLAAESDRIGEVVSGVEVYYRPTVFSLKAFQIILLFLFRRPLAFCRMLLSIAVFFFHSPYEGLSLVKNISTICFFAILLRKLEIKHVHGAFMNWPGRIGYVLSKCHRISYSLAAHARDGYVEGGAIQLKVKSTQFIVCCSQAMSDYIQSKVKFVHHSKIYTIYHGVPVKQIDKISNEISPGSTSLIAIGRFVQKKGFESLLQAFKELLTEYPKSQLVLVGEGPECDKLVKITRRYNIDQKVHFTGWLKHDQLLLKLSQADLLIVPSVIGGDKDQDGIPNVILEAFMLEVPVVASNLAGINEAVIEGQTGVLAKPGCAPELKAAIVRLLSNSKLRDSITEKALQLCNRKFNASINIDEIYSLFCAVSR